MCSWPALWIFLAVVKGGFAGLANEKHGPYDILIRYVEDCSEGDDVNFKIYPRMQRIDRKTLNVAGTLVLKVPVDHNMKWTIQMDQKTAQGFKEKFFFTDFQGHDVCTVIYEYGDDGDIARLFGAIKDEDRNYTGCPVNAGTHQFEVGVLVEPFKKVPLFFYNTYRMFIRFYDDLNNPPKGCIMVMVDFVPKKKRKSSG